MTVNIFLIANNVRPMFLNKCRLTSFKLRNNKNTYNYSFVHLNFNVFGVADGRTHDSEQN